MQLFEPLWFKVLDPLRALILSGELPPGELLSENRLAAQFEVSRTPVREALRILIDEGLVEMLPGRKARVVVPDAVDIEEVYDIRYILEAEAVRRIAQNLDRHGRLLDELDNTCKASTAARKSGDLLALAQSNTDFHTLLVSALANKRVLQQIRAVHNLITFYRHHSLRTDEWAEQGVAEHRKLVALLRAGDVERALGLIQDHLEQAKRVLIQRFHPAASAPLKRRSS